MKKIFIHIFLFYSINTRAAYWTQKANFGGVERVNAFAFSVDSNGYVGGGQNVSTSKFLKDFWAYNPSSNSWTQKADFGGGPRRTAIGLSILGKGYAGLGTDSAGNSPHDFWEYNPATNNWQQKTNVPGVNFVGSISAFTIDSFGYICDAQYLTLWKYNPLANTWTQKTFISSNFRQGAVSFSIGSKGYFGTGFGLGFYQDFWEYDPVTDSWTQRANVPSPVRLDAAAFSIGNRGYIGTGEGPNFVTYLQDFWQYDPSLNQWTQKDSVPGATRDAAISFSIGNKGYIGLGGHDVNPLYIDFWEYTADSTTTIEEIKYDFQFIIYPNPISNNTLCIRYLLPQNKSATFKIFNISGKVVFNYNLPQSSNEQQLTLPSLANGTYSCIITSGSQKVLEKLVVISEH